MSVDMSALVAESHTSRPRLEPAHAQEARPVEGGRCCFLKKLSLVESIIRSTCLRYHFYDQEAEDFKSTVLLRLIEDDYALLRDFREECQWSTYLTTIIRHLGRDLLLQSRGRWHFSKKAEALGLEAMWLETLWTRDGFMLDEAIEYLIRHRLTRKSAQDLHELAEELPARTSRRFVGEDQLWRLQDSSTSEEGIREQEKRIALERTFQLLLQAIRSLDADGKQLLRLQYQEGLNLTEIATRLGVCRRSIYTLRARCLRRLRRFFERHGLSFDEIRDVLGWKEGQLSIDFEQLAYKSFTEP